MIGERAGATLRGRQEVEEDDALRRAVHEPALEPQVRVHADRPPHVTVEGGSPDRAARDRGSEGPSHANAKGVVRELDLRVPSSEAQGNEEQARELRVPDREAARRSHLRPTVSRPEIEREGRAPSAPVPLGVAVRCSLVLREAVRRLGVDRIGVGDVVVAVTAVDRVLEAVIGVERCRCPVAPDNDVLPGAAGEGVVTRCCPLMVSLPPAPSMRVAAGATGQGVAAERRR